MATREQNERRFGCWEDLSEGGRRYWRDRAGTSGEVARYVKIVDRDEQTLVIVQEIYDVQGHLVSVHQKYPVDDGHRYLR